MFRSQSLEVKALRLWEIAECAVVLIAGVWSKVNITLCSPVLTGNDLIVQAASLQVRFFFGSEP